MITTVLPGITEEEPCLLKGVQIRLLQPEERERFDQLMGEQHYLGNAQLVGEQVRYVAEYQGQWVGLVAWSAGAYRLKLREEWIGWNPSQKKRRLSLVGNHSRFLILEGWHEPNLASRLMKLCLQRLSQDWTDLYGHGVLVAESFVDPQQFQGTCYKATGAAGRISTSPMVVPNNFGCGNSVRGLAPCCAGVMCRKPYAMWRQLMPPNVCKRPRNSSRCVSISRGFRTGASASRTFPSAA